MDTVEWGRHILSTGLFYSLDPSLVNNSSQGAHGASLISCERGGAISADGQIVILFSMMSGFIVSIILYKK